MKKSTIVRMLLSPIIFMWGLFLVFGGLVFPTSLIIIISFIGLLSDPLVWLLKKGGVTMDYSDSLFDKYPPFVGHILGTTILIWAPFAITYHFIDTYIIFGINDK